MIIKKAPIRKPQYSYIIESFRRESLSYVMPTFKKIFRLFHLIQHHLTTEYLS